MNSKTKIFLIAVWAFVSVVAASANDLGSAIPKAPQPPGTLRLVITFSAATHGDDPTKLARSIASDYGTLEQPFVAKGEMSFVLFAPPNQLERIKLDPRIGRIDGLPESASTTSSSGAQASRPSVTVAVATTSKPPTKSPIRKAPSAALDPTPVYDYSYDGSGNITAISNDHYAYDPAGRLVQGSAGQGAVTQTYRYDGYGNLTSTTTSPDGARCTGNVDCSIATTIDPATNHITSNQAQYDAAGNLTHFDDYTYAWDAAGMMHRQTGTNVDRQFLYDANDERIATYENGEWHWTWRDLDGKVLRVMTSTDGPNGLGTANLTWVEDDIYRGTSMLASETPTGRRHYHLDHLGSPRLITDDAGQRLGQHTYLPFGAELESSLLENPREAKQFTGHERDLVDGDVHELDYMQGSFSVGCRPRTLASTLRCSRSGISRMPTACALMSAVM